ncbi:MAG: carboxypeptidase-like regulatory domain-containing protein, partial [Candidatus Shapirobacteria bacterium]|nr:carboxypeptidase-like regulatory domain-containing protein [Candidatus Shapirobacteria bacterium]
GKLAGGCIIALVFYALPLPGLVKWFFNIISASAGTIFAFVPFEGRPLETWIISFIKSIYSPSEYVWRKAPVDFPFAKTNQDLPQQDLPPQKETTRSLSVKELALLQALSENKNLYSQEEIDRAQNLLRLFQQGSLSSPNQKQNQPTQIKDQQREVQFGQDLPFPKPPDQPNILVGMVISKDNKIVEGAIIEIKDDNSDTVRAMRTNKLGQFRTVSPLPDGQYQIGIEKTGLNFDIMKIQLDGEIIPPIEIREREN